MTQNTSIFFLNQTTYNEKGKLLITHFPNDATPHHWRRIAVHISSQSTIINSYNPTSDGGWGVQMRVLEIWNEMGVQKCFAPLIKEVGKPPPSWALTGARRCTGPLSWKRCSWSDISPLSLCIETVRGERIIVDCMWGVGWCGSCLLFMSRFLGSFCGVMDIFYCPLPLLWLLASEVRFVISVCKHSYYLDDYLLQNFRSACSNEQIYQKLVVNRFNLISYPKVLN